MRFRVKIQNYRAIELADLELEGITLISGRNLNGKSTLLKFLKTMLQNNSSENDKRHGTTSFSGGVIIDDQIMKFGRDEKPWYQFMNYRKDEKTNAMPLYKLHPQFPFKRIDYQTDKFFPNFSQQNKVPVFDDISVYNLFSMMFSNVAKVADHLNELHFKTINLNKEVADTKAQFEGYQDSRYTAKRALDGFNEKYPTLDTLYVKAKERESEAEKLRSIQLDLEVKRVKVGPVGSCWDTYLDKEVELRDLSSTLVKVESAIQFKDRLESLMKQRVEEVYNLSTLPEVNYEGIKHAVRYASLKASVKSVPVFAQTSEFYYKITAAVRIRRYLDSVLKERKIVHSKVIDFDFDRVIQALKVLKHKTGVGMDKHNVNVYLINLQSDLSKIEEQLKNIEVCPLCKQPMNKEHVHE